MTSSEDFGSKLSASGGYWWCRAKGWPLVVSLEVGEDGLGAQQLGSGRWVGLL